MTEQTHTRGSWTFESYPFGHKPRVFSPGKLIAEVGNAEDETKFHDEWVANARLIAAAPDMLAALKAAIEAEDQANKELVEDFGVGPHELTWMPAVRAAIAKATRQQDALT